MNLVKAFLEKLEDPNLSKDYTIDDFYEEMGVPKKNRSDFATAAIFKQASEMQKDLYPTLGLAIRKAEKTHKLLKERIDLIFPVSSK